jgi:hypothetical protein
MKKKEKRIRVRVKEQEKPVSKRRIRAEEETNPCQSHVVMRCGVCVCGGGEGGRGGAVAAESLQQRPSHYSSVRVITAAS